MLFSLIVSLSKQNEKQFVSLAEQHSKVIQDLIRFSSVLANSEESYTQKAKNKSQLNTLLIVVDHYIKQNRNKIVPGRHYYGLNFPTMQEWTKSEQCRSCKPFLQNVRFLTDKKNVPRGTKGEWQEPHFMNDIQTVFTQWHLYHRSHVTLPLKTLLKICWWKIED